MALVRFELPQQKIIVASVGNVEVRLMGSLTPFNPRLRRGIVGLSSAPNPAPTEHPWTPASLLVLHSDGVQSGWSSKEVKELSLETPGVIARRSRCLARLGSDSIVAVAVSLSGSLDSPSPGQAASRNALTSERGRCSASRSSWRLCSSPTRGARDRPLGCRGHRGARGRLTLRTPPPSVSSQRYVIRSGRDL